jgi:hypothetical protein
MKRRRNSGLHARRVKHGIAAAKAGQRLCLDNDWIHTHFVESDFDGDARDALSMPRNAFGQSVSRDEG